MQKFTLIELLVVISIVGILATILIPSLTKARKASYESVCRSNLRQIGFESTIFLDDNDDRFLFHYWGWDTNFGLEDSKILKCPAEADKVLTQPEDSWYGVTNRDFWLNSPGGWTGNKSHKVSSIVEDSTRYIMFSDSERKVVDWAFTNNSGTTGRHLKMNHISVMHDSHVESQSAARTNSNSGKLVLRAADL